MLLFIVATIAGIAVLALLGGAVGSFEGKKPTAGWSYLGGVFVILVAFSHFGVVMGYWDLPAWVPFSTASLGQPKPPSWLQKGGGSTAPQTPEQLKNDLQAKIQELETKRAALDKVLADLKKEKVEVIDALTSLKIGSTANLKDNPLAQRKAERLQELVREIEKTERKKMDYDLALDRGRTVLRDLDRQLVLQEAGISEEELAKVSTAITFVDEKLREGSDSQLATPLEMDAVLKKELGLKE